MSENFLHYLWQYKKFESLQLTSSEDLQIELIDVGRHNLNSGPDFLNARLKIDGQLWAGNIELHLKSSYWYRHDHHYDKNYDNVILHVVWEHDQEVIRRDNSIIPTLELRRYVDATLLRNYYALFNHDKNWINCEKDFSSVADFVLANWMERLYFERLERKVKEIEGFLKSTQNNWEAVLFKLLCKSFGSSINGEAFLSIANSFEFNLIMKLKDHPIQLEALLFGQARLLDSAHKTNYFFDLKNEYQFLKRKFKLSNEQNISVKFFRLRPINFPTIRLSQLAQLYHNKTGLFSAIIELWSLDEFYRLFSVSASWFWNDHFNFDKASVHCEKKISKAFIDIIMINTIIPIKFSYARFQGQKIDRPITDLIRSIKMEKNGISSKFIALKEFTNGALESQAMLQLKNEYCDKNKCLQCAIGNALLNRNM